MVNLMAMIYGAVAVQFICWVRSIIVIVIAVADISAISEVSLIKRARQPTDCP